MNMTRVDMALEMDRFSVILSLFSELKFNDFNDSAPNWTKQEESTNVHEPLKCLPACPSANFMFS